MSRRSTFFSIVTLVLLQACSSSSSSTTQDSTSGTTPPPNPAPESLPEVRDAGPELDAAVPLGECPKTAGKRLRTLIVGNSQIYYWNLPKLLSVLSESAPPTCPRIDAEGFTHGGANLRYLWTEGDSRGRTLGKTIDDGKYDVVVIAESIDLVELPPPKAQFVEYASLIIDRARASGARPVLYATPYPDQDGHWGFEQMAAPQFELGQTKEVSVAAGGLAWLRVWKELPSVELHHTDHAHPGFKGSMISAMQIYAVLTRVAPKVLTTEPAVDCEGQPCPVVSPAEGEVFQRAAWEEAQATGLD